MSPLCDSGGKAAQQSTASSSLVDRKDSASAKVRDVCKSDIPGSARSKKILVIFPGALGDLICLYPTLHALARRHRGASLELMANDDLIWLAVGPMGVDPRHSLPNQHV